MNILDWWKSKSNSNDLQPLCLMAKKYLCLQASNSSIERAWSQAALYNTKKRNSLSRKFI